MATGAVITNKLADNSVTGVKIANGAVGTGKIADKSITSSKLANDVISTLNDKEDKANKSDTITNNATQYPSNKAVYDLQQDIKSHTDLLVSVGFDANNNVIKIIEGTSLSAGSFTGLTNLAKAFVSSKVDNISSGAFIGCPKLTDIYIDKEKDEIKPQEGAFPDGVNTHYLDDKTFKPLKKIALIMRYIFVCSGGICV